MYYAYYTYNNKVDTGFTSTPLERNIDDIVPNYLITTIINALINFTTIMLKNVN